MFRQKITKPSQFTDAIYNLNKLHSVCVSNNVSNCACGENALELNKRYIEFLNDKQKQKDFKAGAIDEIKAWINQVNDFLQEHDELKNYFFHIDCNRYDGKPLRNWVNTKPNKLVSDVIKAPKPFDVNLSRKCKVCDSVDLTMTTLTHIDFNDRYEVVDAVRKQTKWIDEELTKLETDPNYKNENIRYLSCTCFTKEIK